MNSYPTAIRGRLDSIAISQSRKIKAIIRGHDESFSKQYKNLYVITKTINKKRKMEAMNLI